MNYGRVLSILFCLLLNVSSLYSSEYISSFFKKQDNQLMNVKTYKDNSGKFTLDKAKKLIEENEDLVNTRSSRFWGPGSPMEWVCYPQVFEQFGEEGRLKMAKFFLQSKNLNHGKLIVAFHHCYALGGPKNPNGPVLNLHSWETELGSYEGRCTQKLAKGNLEGKLAVAMQEDGKFLYKEEDLS